MSCDQLKNKLFKFKYKSYKTSKTNSITWPCAFEYINNIYDLVGNRLTESSKVGNGPKRLRTAGLTYLPTC